MIGAPWKGAVPSAYRAQSRSPDSAVRSSCCTCSVEPRTGVRASTVSKLKASASVGKVLVSGPAVRSSKVAVIGYRCLSYTDPFGLCEQPSGEKGSVGVCLEAFIQGRFFGAGDNRGPSAEGGTYKASIRFSIDPSSGTLSGQQRDIGSTFGKPGSGTLTIGAPSSDGNGGWNIALSGSALNGAGVTHRFQHDRQRLGRWKGERGWRQARWLSLVRTLVVFGRWRLAVRVLPQSDKPVQAVRVRRRTHSVRKL